jgi:hypothetical protein
VTVGQWSGRRRGAPCQISGDGGVEIEDRGEEMESRL